MTRELRCKDGLVRVAAFQMPDVQDDLAEAVKAIVAAAAVASQEGASIALFPECFLTGYTRDRRVAEMRSVRLEGERFGSVLAAVADCGPALVFGLIEAHGNQLFNTAVAVDRGVLVGYRKRH